MVKSFRCVAEMHRLELNKRCLKVQEATILTILMKSPYFFFLQVALDDDPVASSAAVEIDQLALPPDAVTGRWKNDLCDCCDVCCKPLCCCSFWCTPITEAQLLTRMKLTWCGEPGTPEQVASTFNIVLVIFICYLVGSTFLTFVLTLPWLIYRLIYATRLRYRFRQKYSKSCE